VSTHRIPLLTDHHSHPSAYAAMNACLDLRGVFDKGQALELIRQRDEELVFVLGWDNSLYTFDRDDLESLPPLFICNAALHSFMINDAAGQMLEPSYREVMANIGGQDWVERNIQTILKLIVNERGCSAEDLRVFFDRILQQGVWSAEEMLLPGSGVIDAFGEADLLERTALWAEPDTFRSLDGERRRHVQGIKLFADGALAARTAAVSEPFLSGEPGILLYSDDELLSILEEFAPLGRPFAIHAVADRATDQVVRVMERARGRVPSLPPVRIEHCMLISKETAERAKALGAILSMQPNFSIESVNYRDRLPEEVCALLHPFRMLIDEVGFVPREDLILGSDGMPHGVEFGLQMAMFPPYRAQRLTLDEFVAGYCLTDLSEGYIDVEIDEESRRVVIREISTK
jgi:predicted amidohydrolase YtcJ